MTVADRKTGIVFVKDTQGQALSSMCSVARRESIM